MAQKEYTKIDDDKLADMLTYIDPSRLEYQEWINVGMALKDNGSDFRLWDNWSMSDSRYNGNEMLAKWDSFKSSGVSIGTVVKMAQDNGWKASNFISVGQALTWDSPIYYQAPPLEFSLENNEDNVIPEDVNYNPMEDTIKYLRLMFKSGDKINVVPKSFYDDHQGKYKPIGKGCTLERDTFIDKLIQYNGDLGAVVGDYDTEAGCWIRINPTDGEGIRDNNITDWKHCLIESDDLPIGKQLEFYKQYNLPIECVVLSGKKSAHAIVKVNAQDEKQYKERVGLLFSWCADKGFKIDNNNKNCSRLSRLPGCYRKDQYQRIIFTNMGYNTWDEWIQSIEIEGFPVTKGWDSIIDSEIQVKPEVIKGVLRQAHKLLIASGSKAGKTFCLLQLAFALGHGYKWLNFECKKCKVLYINLEVDEPSFMMRFRNVNNAFMHRDGLSNEFIHQDTENIKFLTLRGYNKPLSVMKNNLIRRACESGAEVIIIDPIYKITEGDENSAGEMSKFCNMLDEIAQRTNCSLVYAHHYAKGAAGNKASIDRMSGSGVFGRDPDAILTLTKVDVTEEYEQYLEQFKSEGNDSTPRVYRVDDDLREFANFDVFDVVFSAPLHTVDEEGLFAECKLESDVSQSERIKAQKNKEKQQNNLMNFSLVFDDIVAKQNGQDIVSKQKIADELKVSKRTIQNWLNSSIFLNIYQDSVVEGYITKVKK